MGYKILHALLISERDLIIFNDHFVGYKVCGRVEKVLADGKVVLRTGGFRDRAISRDELIAGEAEIITEVELIFHANMVERERSEVSSAREGLIKIRRAEHSAIQKGLNSVLREIA